MEQGRMVNERVEERRNAFAAKPYFSIVQLANNSNDVCFVSVNQKASTFIQSHFTIGERMTGVTASGGSES